MKRIVTTAIALAMSLPLFATNWTAEKISNVWHLKDDSGWDFPCDVNQTFSGQKGTKVKGASAAGDADVLDFSSGIPAELEPILSFNNTFYTTAAKAKIREVVLPSTIVHLIQAFRDCSNLESVTPFLPNTLVTLDTYTFHGCAKLGGRVSLPPTVTSLGTYCFKGSAITDIDLSHVTSVGGNSFYGVTTLTNVVFAEGLQSVGDNAFRGCTGILKIENYVPTTLTSIGAYAFSGLSSLTGELRVGGGESDVTLNSATGHIFGDGTLITKITIGANVPSLPKLAFSCMRSVTEVEFMGCPTRDGEAFGGTKTIAAKWNTAQARWLVPSGNADWIAFMTDTTKVTPWANIKDTNVSSGVTYAQRYATLFGSDADEPFGVIISEMNPFIVVKQGGGSDAKSLVISGDLGGAEALIGEGSGDVEPDYGQYNEVTPPLEVSAPEYIGAGNVRYRCKGYSIADNDGTGWGG